MKEFIDQYLKDVESGKVIVGRQKQVSRQELKDHADSCYCALKYDRSLRRWQLIALDRRVRPLTITGVRYAKPEDIPFELFVRLTAGLVKATCDLWNQETKNATKPVYGSDQYYEAMAKDVGLV